MPINSFNHFLSDFKSYILSEKGLAPNTIEAYMRDLQAFVDYLHRQELKDAQVVEQDHILTYLTELKDKGYASSSMSRTLIALKVFFRFLKREDYLENDITIYLESPKLWQLVPEVLSSQEVDRLLKQPDLKTDLGLRDRAILEVLYSSGLRVTELCDLEIYHVDDEYIRVMGKGSKERLVPIGKKALKAVDDYLLQVRGNFNSEQEKHLFLSRTGKPIDRITIWRRIKEYGKLAGIQKDLSPHTLRHSFATHLLDHGADLRVIQDMLGHADIKSTDRYTQVSTAQVKQAFDAFHPRPEG